MPGWMVQHWTVQQSVIDSSTVATKQNGQQAQRNGMGGATVMAGATKQDGQLT